MRLKLTCFGLLCLALFILRAPAATLYVDLNSANPVSPYTGWSTAATNIQDAIDASSSGDQIRVTNGVYQTGGKVMAGDLTNRVALDKAVTVRSVNGPWVTTIQGAGATNGLAAVRCAWLTNNASLIGFTLKWGATRPAGDTTTLQSGGGVWCAASNAVVTSCIIVSNTAWEYGGGVYQGTLNNSLICSNGVRLGIGSGTCNAVLNNCTVISNAGVGVYVLGPNPVRATNSIIYFNTGGNYIGGGNAFAYCCTTPTVIGTGNFTNAPQLFADGAHLTSTSPCIGAGINVTTGTDIFGKAWANPPSVGCAEFDPAPLITKPQIQLTGDPVGFTANSTISVQSPFLCWWLKDGVPLQDNGHFSFTQTINLVAIGVSFADAGSYQLVLSNAFGVVTSAVAPLVIHCVDVAGTNPIAPYTAWETAAINIQDAIAASVAGDVVLVTNGLYATGGKSMGVNTNRISVDKAILVQSMNGPTTTIIQGAWDPTSTNGPAAVRCAWLTNNAILSGFTLQGGATPKSGAAPAQFLNGGGVWGAATNTPPNIIVANCVILHNVAANYGGGAYAVALHNCILATNSAIGGGGGNSGSGGGAYGCDLRNCVVTSNTAALFGGSGGGVHTSQLKNCVVKKNFLGGANSCTLINCTLTSNNGSGAVGSSLTNCIVYANFGTDSASNSSSSTFDHSCTAPAASGIGNIASDPLLLADGVHLSANSPCLGAGTGVAAFTDIDGQPWNNPPPMGCDEWQPAPVIGAPPFCEVGVPTHGLTFTVIAAGQSPFTCFWSKDGILVQNDGHYSNSGTINLTVNNFGPDDAGIYQVVVSNAFGVVTSQVAQVVIHAVDAAGANPLVPYSTWGTAATNIQDAIDAASTGDIVLVTNGIYATGGKVMAGDLTNRVALDKALTVISANGFASTVIQGARDPVSTNGPGAVRCAYLMGGAVLNGFTLQNGATRTNGDLSPGGPLTSGGGVWCVSTNGIVSNCLLTNNAAVYGGGISHGTLNNCLVVFNQVAVYGGGAYYANLNHCTVANNFTKISSSYSGGGTFLCNVRNSIVLNNFDNWPAAASPDNYFISDFYSYSCTYPAIGTGSFNLATNNPQFLDAFHIASTSPCRGAGSASYTTGTDLDGEPWANPPSMGCDEVVVSNLVGSLSVTLQADQTNLFVYRSGSLLGSVTGRASWVGWSFGDGSTVTGAATGISHQWTNSGDYTVTFTAYNNDNPSGVSTNTIIHIQPLNAPLMQSVVLLANGFQFKFTSQKHANYTVQYCTNLTPPVAWQTFQTINDSISTGTWQITDPTRTSTARFYRVLVQ